jgi:uncharacterized protein
MSETGPNPCLECGACCMSYRVSFYWAEAEGLAPAMTERLTPHIACMAGTNASRPRCAALQSGADGTVACAVYAQRPSPCREVEIGDEKCNKARFRHGLGALGAPAV